MTLKLILMRHAKAGWDDPAATDHARSLTHRGEVAAQRIGNWLRTHGHFPKHILCSDATRTSQTVAALLETRGGTPEITSLRVLYHAAPDVILTEIRKVQGAQTLLVCGHNPGIGDLAKRLVTTPPVHARFDDFPTAATTVITFDTDDWSKVRTGICTAFITPADLTT